MYTLREDFQTPHSDIQRLIRGTWTWKSCGAAFGLFGGLIAPIFGSIATVISWFSDPAWHSVTLHQAGTFSFLFAIPLLILGAHCLDLLDQEKKLAQASQRFERNDASSGEKGNNHDVERN